MKTERQIENVHDRAAKLANVVVKADQQDHFAAARGPIDAERGDAMNAAGFAARALALLENGDYDGFLTCLSLAGQFNTKARDAAYRRK
jgi:hypothetical protein